MGTPPRVHRVQGQAHSPELSGGVNLEVGTQAGTGPGSGAPGWRSGSAQSLAVPPEESRSPSLDLSCLSHKGKKEA